MQVSTKDGSGLEFTVSSPLTNAPAFGYYPLHVTIRNNYTARRSWTIRATQASNGDTANFQETVTAEPMETKSIWLMIPMERSLEESRYARGGFSLSIDGDDVVSIHGYVPALNLSAPNAKETAMRTILFNDSTNVLMGHFESDYKDEFDVSFSPILEFPADWRGYTGVKSVWLQIHEWNQLAEAQRQALIEWIFQGGNLYFASFAPDSASKGNPLEPPAKGEEMGTALENDEHKAGPASVVLSENTDLTALPSELRKRCGDSISQAGNRGWKFGLGTIHHVELSAITSPDSVHQIVAHIQHVSSNSLFHRLFDRQTPNVINTNTYSIEKVPGGLLLVIVVIYVVGLGVISTRTLQNPSKRYRIFIQVPAFSMCACIGILLTILLADGIGGRGTQVAVVAILPNESHQALILQEQTVKTGSLWSKYFSLPENVAFSEIPQKCASPLSCPDPAFNQHRTFQASPTYFSGDYFTARSVTSHAFQHFTFLRGGIELRNRNGAPDIIEARSTLPVSVNRLWVSIDGKQYAGNLISPGQWSPLNTQEVNKLLQTIPGTDNSISSIPIESSLVGTFARLNTTSARQPPGWIAISDNPSGLLLQTHPGIRWEKRQLVVVGQTFDSLDHITAAGLL